MATRVGLTEIWIIPFDCPQFGANILHVSLTVPELWLFEVAIGRNAHFQILGVKGGFQFLLTKPYEECECHQNASFKPLTAIIGPTGGPVVMSMELKNLKNRRLTMTVSRMRTLGRLIQIFCLCGGVTDVINCAIFWKIGSGVPELEDLEKWHFPLKAFIALTTVLRYRADCD